MEPGNIPPHLTVLKCRLCLDPLVMVNFETNSVWTDTFVSLYGAVYCSDCWPIMGVRLKAFFLERNHSIPFGHN